MNEEDKQYVRQLFLQLVANLDEFEEILFLKEMVDMVVAEYPHIEDDDVIENRFGM